MSCCKTPKPLVLLIIFITLLSCNTTDDSGITNDSNAIPPPLTDVILSGRIESELTLDAALVYELRGSVVVTNGATLNIPAGTTFVSNSDDGLDALIIDQGARIEAIGTAQDPIVFTTSVQQPGEWGGIVILGNAPINVAGGISSPEFDDTLSYGGNDPEDDSGILSFVRVEYAGASVIEGAVEFNGFAFYAVGSGTTVNNLQAFSGADDGFEWFGGAVIANNLLSNGNEDDSFDWTEGWTGGGSNWIAVQQGFGDNGFEADNNVDNNTSLEVSNPTISNITINGLGVNDGMRLRRGTAGRLSNVIINNFADGIDIRDNFTIENIQNGVLEITQINIENVERTIIVEGNTDLSPFIMLDNTATGADESVFQGWTIGF